MGEAPRPDHSGNRQEPTRAERRQVALPADGPSAGVVRQQRVLNTPPAPPSPSGEGGNPHRSSHINTLN